MQIHLKTASKSDLEKAGFSLYQQRDYHQAMLNQISNSINAISQELSERTQKEQLEAQAKKEENKPIEETII